MIAPVAAGVGALKAMVQDSLNRLLACLQDATFVRRSVRLEHAMAASPATPAREIGTRDSAPDACTTRHDAAAAADAAQPARPLSAPPAGGQPPLDPSSALRDPAMQSALRRTFTSLLRLHLALRSVPEARRCLRAMAQLRVQPDPALQSLVDAVAQ